MGKRKLMRERILNIALPSGLTFLLDVINLTVAIFFIGRLGADHIAALGVGINYVVVCYIAVSSVFYVGTNAQVSRFFGARQNKHMNEAFSTMFYTCILASIPVLMLSYAGIKNYVIWMGLIPLTAELTREFLYISIFLVPIFIIKNVIVSAFSAVGNTKIPFYVKISMTLVNLALGYTLILGIEGFNEGLGIEGSALTNIIVACSELFLLLLAVLSQRFKISFCASLNWQYFKRGLKIGFPSGMERICTFFALLLIAKFLVKFGDEVMAGAQIGERIESFCYMPGFGFMVTSMSLVGQCIGAGNISRARHYTRQTMQISGIIMGSVGFLMIVFARPLAELFSDNAGVIHSAEIYLFILGLSQVPLVWMFVLDGVIRGSGKTMYSLFINCGSIWCLRLLPMWILLKTGFDYRAIYACVTIETFLRAGIFYYFYKKGVWSKNLKLD